ncbi:MAG: hypothetical protein ABR949_08885 [Candidatus Aquilonibacter sp.]|jgi:hypothetical protein
MNVLPAAPALHYQAKIGTSGGTISASSEKLVFYPGSGWSITASNEAELTLTSTSAPSPIVNPTWASAFAWMQHRSLLVHAEPSPAPPVDVRLPTIAVVSAAPGDLYRVVHEQDGVCPDGEPGRRQQVAALHDPDSHPLVGTIINDRTGLFCSLDYQESVGGSGLVEARGSAELRFTSIGSYYLMTSAQFRMHAESDRGPVSMSAEISLSDFEPLR